MRYFVIVSILVLQMLIAFVENNNVEAAVIKHTQVNKRKFIRTENKEPDLEKSKQILQNNHDNNSTLEKRNSLTSRKMKHFRTNISNAKYKSKRGGKHFPLKYAAISNSSKQDNHPKPFISLKMKNNRLKYHKLRHNKINFGKKLKIKQRHKIQDSKSEKGHIGKASNVAFDQNNSLNNQAKLLSAISMHHARDAKSSNKLTLIAAKNITNTLSSNESVTISPMSSYALTREYSVNTWMPQSDATLKIRNKDGVYISTSSEKDMAQTLQLETGGTILNVDEEQNSTSSEKPVILTSQVEFGTEILSRSEIQRSRSSKNDVTQKSTPIYKEHRIQSNGTEKIITVKTPNNKIQNEVDYFGLLERAITSLKSNNLETTDTTTTKRDVSDITKKIQSISANKTTSLKDLSQREFNFKNEKFKKFASPKSSNRDMSEDREIDLESLKNSVVYPDIAETNDSDNNTYYINIESDTLNERKAEIKQKLKNIFETNITSNNFTYLYINATKTRLRIMVPTSENGSVSLHDIEQLIDVRISENLKDQVKKYLLEISICQRIIQFYIQHSFLAYFVALMVIFILIFSIFMCCLCKAKMMNTLKEFQNQNRYHYYQPLKLSEPENTGTNNNFSGDDEMKQYEVDVESDDEMKQYEDDEESLIQIERRKSQKKEKKKEKIPKESEIDVDVKQKETCVKQIMKDKETPSGVTEYVLNKKSHETKPLQKKIEISKDEIVSGNDDEVKEKSEKQKKMKFPEQKMCDYHDVKISSETEVKSRETVKSDAEKNSEISSEPLQKKIEISKDEIVRGNDDEVKEKSEKQKKMKFPEQKTHDYHDVKISSETEVKRKETAKSDSEKNREISSESVAGKDNEKRKKKSRFRSSKKKMQTSPGESDIQEERPVSPARRLSRWMQRIFKTSKSENTDKEMTENKDSLQPSTSGSSRSPSEVDKTISQKTVEEKKNEEMNAKPLPRKIISESGLPVRLTFPPAKSNAPKKNTVATDDYKKIDGMLTRSDWDKLFLSSGNDLRSEKQEESLQSSEKYFKKRSLDSLRDVMEKSISDYESAAGSSPKAK